MQEHQARLEALSALAGQLAARQQTVIAEQLDSVRRRHISLGQQLLHLVRQVGGGGLPRAGGRGWYTAAGSVCDGCQARSCNAAWAHEMGRDSRLQGGTAGQALCSAAFTALVWG